MGKVTGGVKIFYEDQKGPSEYCISVVIDLEYAEKAKKLEKNTQKYILKQEAKEQFISGNMTTEEILLQNNSFDETNQLC